MGDMMGTILRFLFLLCALAFSYAGNAAPINAQSGLAVEPFSADEVNRFETRISGSQCSFFADADEKKIVLLSDWVSKVWVKLDGKTQELVSADKPDTGEQGEYWRQVFRLHDLAIAIDLKTVATGAEDTMNMAGTMTIRRGKQSRQLKITGGCAA
jgi:hypothetical protein